MDKKEWQYYRERLKKDKEISCGDKVVATYRWNFGSTENKRVREIEARLEFIDDRGIVIGGKRISYKSLECISSLSDHYEPDAALTPEGWVAEIVCKIYGKK